MTEVYRFELKEFDTSTLTANFQNLGSALTQPARYVHILNTSTVDVYISIDGSTNTFRIPAGKDLPIPSYPKHNNQNEGAFVFTKGTQLQIKQITAAAAGVVVVHVFI